MPTRPITVRGGDYCGGTNSSATITMGICSDAHGEQSPALAGAQAQCGSSCRRNLQSRRKPVWQALPPAPYPSNLPELPYHKVLAGGLHGGVADLMEALRPIAVVFG